MKIFPTCNQYLCLHLLPVLMLSVMITVASSDCNRVCSHGRKRLEVQYPFGFSGDCEIPLNCTEGRIHIGEFEVNVTDQSIMVTIPSKCNRSIEVLKPLFGPNYAPTLRNGLLVQNCTSPPTSCVIPGDLIGSLFQQGCDRPYCYSKMKNDSDYTSMADLEQSSCSTVLSSVSVAFDRGYKNMSLELETIKLGWWLEGECNCSSNAKQRNITSPVNGRRSCRCWCASGFHGDGFAAGVGCWKVDYPYSGSRLKQKLVVGVSIGGVGIFIVLLLLYRKRLYNLYTTAISKNSPKVEEFLKSYGSLSLQRYKFSDIKKMTNFFYKKVGQGGYGSVFEGKLRDGSFVAVKILNESKGDGEEFLNEVVTIGRTNHVNVVRLLGFSIEGTKRALVYEYMSNGSLEKFIYNHNDTSTTTYAHLGWEKLFQITQGIARGLEYLHRGCNDRILHFDIKPHNILLDHDFCPKISDFGLAKLCLTKESYVSMVGARGTVGYIAPELCCRNFGVVSHKSDVYSYGMMVLEMIGGRRNIDTTVENISEIYFPHWIYKQIQQNNVEMERQEESIIEESNRNFENATAKRMIIVALWCIQSHPVDRPSMSKVVEMLETNDEIPMPPNPALDPRPTDEMSPISEVKHVIPLNKDNYHKLITSSSG